MGALVIGAAGSPALQHSVGYGGPGCPFKAITGVDCPFCGMTRATIAIGDGDWSAALSLHPLAPVVIAGMLALVTMIIVGRADALTKGRRSWLILGAIGVIWVLRLVL